MLSALDLARRIEAGELRPPAVVELCAAAIAARESEIGAFAALDIAAARRSAERPDLARLPLRGLPVGIKDIFDTTQFPTAYGSPIYTGHRPQTDAAMVMLVRRAGGIAAGKTVTTEFASLEPAATRNPRNLAHTPGGSSSGSAAAVAAGMLPLALGSQTGGSVIRPASFCGVAGFKPSYRLFPTVGMKCFAWSLDTVGLFGAGVADVAFAAAALSGRDLRVDRRRPAPPVIALVRTHLWHEASAAMQDAVARAARAAEMSGAKIRDLDLPPIFADATRAHRVIQGYEAFRALAFEYDDRRDRLGPVLRRQLDDAASIDADAYDQARRTTRRARQALLDLLADGEVILTPSAPGAAPPGLSSTGEPTFNRLWTLLGTPCVNIPGLSDQAGLPLGVQIVARFGRDRFALSAPRFSSRRSPEPSSDKPRPSANLKRHRAFFRIMRNVPCRVPCFVPIRQAILMRHQRTQCPEFASIYQGIGIRARASCGRAAPFWRCNIFVIRGASHLSVRIASCARKGVATWTLP